MDIKTTAIILFMASFFMILSCESSVDDTKLINREINRKLSRFKKNKLRECRLKALDDAEIYVDSIIRDITINAVNSSIDFPEKPEGRDTSKEKFDVKIDSVEIIKIVDSLNIKRVEIIDSIESDTILD